MKFKFGMIAIMLMILTILFIPDKSESQTIYTNSGNSKYVKTTVDTFSVPGVKGVMRYGFVSNQSSSKQLLVYFSDRDGVKDTSSRVLIEPGKTLHFGFVGTKIFRNAVTDSAYSQVIIGDVKLNSIYDKRDFNLCSADKFYIEKYYIRNSAFIDRHRHWRNAPVIRV